MLPMRSTVSIGVCLFALAGAALPVAGAEQIEVGDLGGGLHGVVFRPEGTGPFPAVVALHGCGGLINRTGNIAPRFADWGNRLAGAGIGVLFPDSFTSRGITSQCAVRERKVRSSRERVADAQVSRRWLQSQSWA